MKKILYLLILLALAGATSCDSIFLKKGKGIVRVVDNSAKGPTFPGPGDDSVSIEVEVSEGDLVFTFSQDLGPVKLILATRLSQSEVWSTMLDTSQGELRVEIPATVPSGTYHLILEDEAGKELYNTLVYIS